MKAAIARLKSHNEQVPNPLRLPTEGEIKSVEKELGLRFHPDYKKYLLEASDVVLGVLEPATILKNSAHTYLVPLAKDAWKMGLPRDLLPIVSDNGDYYCIDSAGHMLFWSHNGTTNETWPNLASWIKDVWIEGN